MSVIRLTPCRYDSPAASGRCKGAVLPHIASGRRELNGESAKLERTNDGKITQGRGINSDGGEASLASDTSGLKLRHGVSRHNTAITESGSLSGRACDVLRDGKIFFSGSMNVYCMRLEPTTRQVKSTECYKLAFLTANLAVWG